MAESAGVTLRVSEVLRFANWIESSMRIVIRLFRRGRARARRFGLGQFAIFLRRVLRFLPSRVTFAVLVLMEVNRVRGRTLLATAFRPTIIRRLKTNPGLRLSSWITKPFQLRTAAVLARLGQHGELTELLTAEALAIRSMDASVRLAWALFELGDFKRALEVVSAWSTTRSAGHDTLIEARGLLTLIVGSEGDAVGWLEAAAKGMPHLMSPHQNIAGRYTTDYVANRIDIASGAEGRLYDSYNFIGQRVTHIGEGQLGARLYAGALRAQKQLRTRMPKPSVALEKLLDRLGLALDEVRIVPVEWFTQIGHQGMIDILLRMRDLGWWKGKILFLVPTDKVANHAFLSLYEKQGTILPWHNAADKKVMAELFSYQRYCGLSFNAFEMPNGEVLPWQEAGAIAIRRWEAEKRDAPLKEEFDRQFGVLSSVTNAVEQTMRHWGLGPEDWYVCLHMRDASHYGEIDGAGQTHRNASVKRYMAAIKYITSQGGWVIKLGGPASPKLPKMPRVIDYSRSKFKSEIMDLHLIRHARYFIGTTSGLTNVAISFDIPCALVNCITVDAQLWGSKVRFALKSVVLKDGKPLGQRDLTTTPWRWRVFSAEVLTRHEATAFENTADEILETVKEVHCLANGQTYLSPLDGSGPGLIGRWRRCLGIDSFYGNALPGLYFLEKNADHFLKSETLQATLATADDTREVAAV